MLSGRTPKWTFELLLDRTHAKEHAREACGLLRTDGRASGKLKSLREDICPVVRGLCSCQLKPLGLVSK